MNLLKVGVRFSCLALIFFFFGLYRFGGGSFGIRQNLKQSVFWTELGLFTAVASLGLIFGGWLKDREKEWESDQVLHAFIYAAASILLNLVLWLTSRYFLPTFG